MTKQTEKLLPPETIYLLEMDEDEWVWCDVESPDYDERVAVKYTRTPNPFTDPINKISESVEFALINAEPFSIEEVVRIAVHHYRGKLPVERTTNLCVLDSDEAVEVVARATAISIYHSAGLETMNYMGDKDCANREWHHYKAQAEAAIQAVKKILKES
jgi:hypothetical protein